MFLIPGLLSGVPRRRNLWIEQNAHFSCGQLILLISQNKIKQKY